MPLYTYKCHECETKTNAIRKIADRKDGPSCPECGEQTEQITVPTMVHVPSWDRYICPVTRQEVTSERQRKSIMAEHDLIDANDFGPAKRPEADD